LLALRFQHASGGSKEPHKFQELKVSIARALTIISEKENIEGKEK
jgi:ribosomal protein L29